MGILDGKVAVVTGGSRGMGEIHVRELVNEGAKVIISDLNEELGEKVSEDIGDNTIFVKHDVTNFDDWENIIIKARETFGSIDILVNNAGVGGPHKKINDLSIADYKTTIDVDLNGVFLGMKALIPHMIDNNGGSIINISSVAGLRHDDVTPNAAYTAAKHGVIGLTRAGAVEYANKNIKINAICPGTVLTPLLEENLSEEELEAVGSTSPIGRFANSKEISQAIIFLASDKSSYINGEYIVVDGGTAAS
ncbi:SDR family NAD(P)-dependent oxidoreductase [Oceanobacillus piezotolerans]|nr:glucose 1-dehydrogenase [Oceanobacillus piezotolerans]